MRLPVLLVLALPVAVSADQVFLYGGGVVTGVVVERNAKSIVMEVGPGRIAFPQSRVERIVEGSSDVAVYRDRADHLAKDDAPGWMELALWARDRGLLTQARAAFERVAALDPGNQLAQRAIGNVLLGDRWVSAEEGFRARGYVPFEGRWVTPAEHDAALREQADAALASRARAEAAARVREAEARADAAEAQARAAQASGNGGSSVGLPYGYGGFGGSALVYNPYAQGGRYVRSNPYAPSVRQHVQPSATPSAPPAAPSGGGRAPGRPAPPAQPMRGIRAPND